MAARAQSLGASRPTPLFLGTVMLVLAAALVPNAAAAAVPSKPVPTFGTNGEVHAVAQGGGNIYLGGSFTQVGRPTGSIAALSTANGNADPAMPGISSLNHSVTAVAPDGAGGWYIGGHFTHVAGVPRRNIAHIRANKTVDPNFNPNANGDVYALAVSGSTLYVGGYFNGTNSIGGANRNYVAALNASTGTATSWNPNANGAVRALAISGSTVYVGGYFDSIGGQTRSHIAALNSSTGTATGWNPNPNGSYVLSVAVSGSTVYAGGAFSSIGGKARNYVAALDATTGAATNWNPNANSDVWAFALSGSTVYVSGSFTSIGGQTRNHIAALNKTTGAATNWNPNANSDVWDLAVSGSTVYACGAFSSIGGKPRNDIAALDASTGNATAWNARAQLENSYVWTLAVSGSTVYAGGGFKLMNVVNRKGIAALNAVTGTPTSWNPNVTADAVRSIAVSGSTVYLGGDLYSVGGQTRSNIAAVDATTGTPTSWNPNADSTVYALAVAGSTVYAGGSFTTIGGQARNHIAALNATTGAATGWSPASSTVMDLAISGSTVYTGGSGSIVALDATSGAARWSASANSTVRAIAISGSTVYAGGLFNGTGSIGGANRNYIAALNANTGAVTSWNPSASDSVVGVGVSGSTVYLGGDFTSIGGQMRNRLAALDSGTGALASWNPSPVQPQTGFFPVYALTVSGSTVYVGGLFPMLQSGPAGNFAAFQSPPQNTALPAIAGTPRVGNTLTCSKGAWSGGTPQAYSRQWLRDGSAIAGQTATTYTVRSADRGHVLRCRVTAQNLAGKRSATSAAVKAT